MIALAALCQDIFGTSTIATGMACTPTSPASLNVTVAPGNIYALANIDNTAYSSIAADTAHQIVKQGISLDPVMLTCAAPTTSGQSVNYLIQAAFEEVDTDALVLPYYNASAPTQPYSGPNNNGAPNYTTRSGTVVLSAKAGIAAATGSQATPAPDSGAIGLWVVTVAYGATTIPSGSITAYGSSSLLSGSVLTTAGRLTKAGSIYYQGIPPVGTTTTYTKTLTFTAPCNGVVSAQQSCNVGSTPAVSTQPGLQTNKVVVTGSTSGSSNDADSTSTTMCNTIVHQCVAGETVTIVGTLVADGAAGTWCNNGITLSYIFGPTL